MSKYTSRRVLTVCSVPKCSQLTYNVMVAPGFLWSTANTRVFADDMFPNDLTLKYSVCTSPLLFVDTITVTDTVDGILPKRYRRRAINDIRPQAFETLYTFVRERVAVAIGGGGNVFPAEYA